MQLDGLRAASCEEIFIEKASGEILYRYYVPLADYPGVLGKTDCNLAYGKAMPANCSEAMPSWIAYHND